MARFSSAPTASSRLRGGLPILILLPALLVAQAPSAADVAAPPAAGSRSLTLEEVLPADTLLFASFAGIESASRAAEGLGLYRFFSEPETQVFLKDVLGTYSRIAADTPEDDLDLWRSLVNTFRGSISVAVTGITPGGMPPVAAVVAIDVGDQREAADRFLQMAISRADTMLERRGTPIEHGLKPFKGVDVHLHKVDAGGMSITFCHAYVENLLLISINQAPIRKIILELERDGENTLATNPVFARCRKKSPGHRMLEVYAGAHAATKRFKLVIPNEVLDQMASLGLDDIGALYMASSVFDGDTVETVYLDAPSPRKGLLTLDNGRPISEGSLRLIPEDALLAIGIRCDVARAWDQIWASAEALAEAYFPQALDDAGSEIDELAENLGFRLREDLLEALGDEVVIYAGVPTDFRLPKVVASIAIKDADKTHDLLQSLLARLPVRVQEVTYGNHTLRVATPTRQRDQAPLSPCYVLTGDRLLISATRSGLEQALDRLADPECRGIVGSPNFREALGALHWKDASAFCYLDTKRVLSLGYEAAYDVLPGLLAGNREIPLDPLALPRLQTFLKHIKSFGGTVVGDEDGIVARARTIGLATIISLAGRTVDRAEGALPWVISRLGNQMFGRGLQPVAPTEVSPGIPAPNVVNPLHEEDSRNKEVVQRILARLAAMKEADETSGSDHFELAMDYLRVRQYEKAIDHYRKALDAEFNVPTTTYNIACCLSLLDRKEEALQWLEKALDAGFNSRPLLETDTDLDNIRHLPGFKKLRTRLQ